MWKQCRRCVKRCGCPWESSCCAGCFGVYIASTTGFSGLCLLFSFLLFASQQQQLTASLQGRHSFVLLCGIRRAALLSHLRTINFRLSTRRRLSSLDVPEEDAEAYFTKAWSNTSRALSALQPDPLVKPSTLFSRSADAKIQFSMSGYYTQAFQATHTPNIMGEGVNMPLRNVYYGQLRVR